MKQYLNNILDHKIKKLIIKAWILVVIKNSFQSNLNTSGKACILKDKLRSF